MKTASAASIALHATVLAWTMISFSGKTFDVTPVEALPVDLVSVEEFTKLAKGAKDAPKQEKPAPLVEKKDEPKPKPPDEIKPKVTEKKEVAPAPAAKPSEPEPPKPDPIADKIAKSDEPKPQQVAEPKPLPPRRPPVPKQQKFDADKIAALLDKREPQRNVSAGDLPSQAPGLGTSTGNDKRLSASELEALRARLMALWNPPVGIQNPQDFIIRVRIQLRPDGRLSGPPAVLSSGSGQLFMSARDSAIRAVFRAQPFDMLKRETYDTWKDIEVTFDPRDMFRG